MNLISLLPRITEAVPSISSDFGEILALPCIKLRITGTSLVATTLPGLSASPGRSIQPSLGAVHHQDAQGDATDFYISRSDEENRIAHSIALMPAAIGTLDMASRYAEAVIAASAMATALNNLLPIFQKQRWAAAVVSGLIRGFGLPNVLNDVGLSGSSLVLGLLAFNLLA